jgi:hypothetical protein
MNWASEHSIASLPWRAVGMLVERKCRPYGDHFDRENEALRPNNTVPWQTNLETTKA